jgi:8-oxo-(d)GTP phosphatase
MFRKYCPAMAVFLVRHAVAVGRGRWDGPDELRPLTKRGGRQARGLVKLLGDRSIRRVMSSPAVRCVETIRPLADAIGQPIKERTELLEGAKTRSALELLADAARRRGDSVACCHGDLIPEVLWSLAAEGARFEGAHRWEKGSIWLLEWEGGRCTAGRYLPPVEA